MKAQLMNIACRVPWLPDLSTLRARGVLRDTRTVASIFFGVALWFMMARSLRFEFQWHQGMLNPDCLIQVRDGLCLSQVPILLLIAWFLFKQPAHPRSLWLEPAALETRFFSPELRDYYRCHPARLRFLKRAIRRNNINRVRALVARGTPLRAQGEYLSALELAELYGNEAIINLLRSAGSNDA